MARVPNATPPTRVVVSVCTPAGQSAGGATEIPGRGSDTVVEVGLQAFEHRAEVGRERRLPAQPLAAARVRKLQARGVQRLAAQALEGLAQARMGLAGQARAAAVHRVADQRQPGMRHVDPDLVGAPGLQAYPQVAVGAVFALDAEVGNGGLARTHHGLALAIARMPADGRIDGAPGNGDAGDDAMVLAGDRALMELGDQAVVRRQVARDHHQPGRVLVQAVDDARAGNRLQAAVEVQQPVLQGPARVSRRGMDDEAGRLVDNEDVLVFMDDGEIHGLGGGVQRGIAALGDAGVEHHRFAATDRRARRRAGAVDLQMAGFQPLLQAGAGILGEQAREDAVKAGTGGAARDVADIGFRILHGSSEVATRIGYNCGSHHESVVMPYRTLFLALLVSLALVVGGCAGRDHDRTADWSAERLYDEAKRAMDGANFEEAIDYFEILEARYPFGDLALQAQLDIAYAYYRFGEDDAAIQAADRFIRLHPTHEQVAYAYYLRGLVRYNRGHTFLHNIWPMDMSQADQARLRRAFDDFRSVVEQHPDSDYAEDAHQRMVFLRNEMARHEFEVAEFYFRRSAYTAAINRIDYLLDHYDGATVMEEGLALQIRAYERLGMDDRADEARRVLTSNWPDHPLAES